VAGSLKRGRRGGDGTVGKRKDRQGHSRGGERKQDPLELVGRDSWKNGCGFLRDLETTKVTPPPKTIPEVLTTSQGV